MTVGVFQRPGRFRNRASGQSRQQQKLVFGRPTRLGIVGVGEDGQEETKGGDVEKEGQGLETAAAKNGFRL